MICDCINRKEYYEPHPDEEFSEFKDSIEIIKGNENYLLCKCPKCYHLYAVEPNSRGPLIVKVSNIKQFDEFNETPYRKMLFIKFNGGLSNKV